MSINDSNIGFMPKTTLKDTNPKDIFGSSKIDTGLVPDSAIIAEALAFSEGALKYGRYNWRIAGVRASVYNAALRRHLSKWWNGEDVDPDTGVPHLASIRACCAILLDASLVGKLTDDRPPKANMTSQIDYANGVFLHLKDVFQTHNPKQYTIEDSK